MRHLYVDFEIFTSTHSHTYILRESYTNAPRVGKKTTEAEKKMRKFISAKRRTKFQTCQFFDKQVTYTDDKKHVLMQVQALKNIHNLTFYVYRAFDFLKGNIELANVYFFCKLYKRTNHTVGKVIPTFIWYIFMIILIFHICSGNFFTSW